MQIPGPRNRKEEHEQTKNDHLFLCVCLLRDLRDNRITTFGRAIFLPLHSLQTLYLNGNAIKALAQPWLPWLPALRTLSLSDNRIEHIDAGALMLPRLEHL